MAVHRVVVLQSLSRVLSHGGGNPSLQGRSLLGPPDSSLFVCLAAGHKVVGEAGQDQELGTRDEQSSQQDGQVHVQTA